MSSNLVTLLREWPYSRDFVLETMDHDLIQCHGEWILSRALNIGRTVAFVGSGVSMCYGRISWRELARAAVSAAEQAMQNAIGQQNRLEFESEHPRIAVIEKTLTHLKPQSGKDQDEDQAWLKIAPPTLLVLFQIADELGEALCRIRKSTIPNNPVRDKVRRLVYNDSGHARRLLEAVVPQDELKRRFTERLGRELTRDLTSELAPYQQLFKRSSLTELASRVGTQYRELGALLTSFAGDASQTSPYLNPTHRFAMAAALAAWGPQQDPNCYNQLFPPSEPRARERSEMVDPMRDPLEIMVEKLGLRRFITTNYDVDIEQLILDRGFHLRKFTDASAGGDRIGLSVSALEAVARDFVFQKGRAAHLIDFAVQDTSYSLDLVHLHGRATEGDELVATEADYQRLYLGDEGGRDLLDGAIDLAFRGNTLLFVGNGMGEDDLLRPLRHFMSEAPNGRESVGIALLPDTKGKQSRVEEKALLLRRYGVYTIHYGHGSVKDGEGDYVLSGLIAIVRILAAEISRILPGGGNGDGSALKMFKELSVKIPVTCRSLLTFKEDIPSINLQPLEWVERQAPDIIAYELKTIDYLFGLCMRAASVAQPEWEAANILARNVEDALIAGFLSAALLRLKMSWTEWRRSWFSEVHPRVPSTKPFTVLVADLPKHSSLIHPRFGLTIDRRRAICLRDYDGKEGDYNFGRRFHVEWSQTLAYACEAFRKHAGSGDPVADEGRRRVFVLAGPRGAGKGQFFSALTERSGLLAFLEASWSGHPKHDTYMGAFAFNLSFSVEFGSGFDRLIRFLHQCIRQDYASVQGGATFDQLYYKVVGCGANEDDGRRSGNRIGALQLMLRVLAGGVPGLTRPSGRLVLLFNASHLLFTRSGYSKSADITRIMNALLSPEFEGAALDLIFVTDERGMPIEFRRRKSHSRSTSQGQNLFRERPPYRWGLEIVRSVVDPLRNDVEDQVAMSKLGLRSSAQKKALDGRALFLRLQPSLLGVVVAAAFPAVLAAAVAWVQGKSSGQRTVELRLLPQAGDQVHAFIKGMAEAEPHEGTSAKGIVDRHVFTRGLAKLNVLDGFAVPTQATQIESLADRIDFEFARYFKAFRGNRFALTLAFAAAEEEFTASDGSIAATIAVLNEIRDKSSGVNDPSRSDAIVRSVLAVHRRNGVRQKSFAALWNQARAQPPELKLISQYCDELLVALAMIGHPIEMDCLAELLKEARPTRNLFDGTPTAHSANPGSAEPEPIRIALDVLVLRCLVFRFGPSRDGGGDRFAVHRYIQRHVFRHLEQPLVENAERESYMPTLYASQPNDLPYPTAAAQERIREMVAVLSQYPSRPHFGDYNGKRSEDLHLQSRMLRAAHGVIRTVYGVGIVARFFEHGKQGTQPEIGYFEEHRRQVRWLLKRAQELSKTLQGSDRPLYCGEIAWLYNECGVLSLAQGRLNDAGALFAESIRALNPIERRGTPAALTTAVRLNRALVDIERGNLRKASASLQTILIEEDEHRALRWIAYGYQGLIAHIRGDLDAARTRYGRAIAALSTMKRYRAASIFSRHCADLHRRLGGEEQLKEASRLVNESVNWAAAGSHADVQHQARLSRVQIIAAQRGTAAFASLRKELSGIEEYARVMGMPRLEVDVAYVDAFFRRKLGDRAMAMKVVTRGLAIANECDLVLRKISGMLLAADISNDLGMRDGAKTLAETAKTMATTAEFSTAQELAQSLLASM